MTRWSQSSLKIAVAELSDQKDRLDAYEVQARFALADIYDRAADQADGASGGGAAAPGAPAAPSPAPAPIPAPAVPPER